ncbi:hypothetical protein BpHYR1_018901, partial [Brachionus plicatilis]
VKQESTTLAEKKSSIKSSKESSSFDKVLKCKEEPTEPKIDPMSRPEVKFNPEKKYLKKSESMDEAILLNSKADCIQEQIAMICKTTLKPYFLKNKIDKEDYKMIMKKVVNKVRVHVKNLESLNTKKVIDLTMAYVKKSEKS